MCERLSLELVEMGASGIGDWFRALQGTRRMHVLPCNTTLQYYPDVLPCSTTLQYYPAVLPCTRNPKRVTFPTVSYKLLINRQDTLRILVCLVTYDSG